jgi:uncharacterized protein (DUF58 family)
MSLTRRGKALVAVVVVGVAMAGLYGPRALNAVVVPSLVALLAGVVLVRRARPPDVERVAPDDGFAGEDHDVELRLSAERSYTARVHDAVDDALAPAGNDVVATVGGDPVEYDLTYSRRGEHAVGPTTVTARDVLGVAEREFRVHNETTVLVYPTVYDLGGPARAALNGLPQFELTNMRGEFDTLREYRRGDALRDVDWKSSAKRADDQFIVKEYVDEDDLDAVTLVAEADGDPAAADAMAEAAASVASFLLAAGLTVGLNAPEGVLDPAGGRSQRRRVLELLARTGAGNVPDGERAAADVLVVGHADGTATVRAGGDPVPFETPAAAPTDGGRPAGATTDGGSRDDGAGGASDR